MAKLNWNRARQQKHAQKYGVEIDYSVGADPNKIPKYSNAKDSPIMRRILGTSGDDDDEV